MRQKLNPIRAGGEGISCGGECDRSRGGRAPGDLGRPPTTGTQRAKVDRRQVVNLSRGVGQDLADLRAPQVSPADNPDGLPTRRPPCPLLVHFPT